jgi:hypothetical protein
MRELNNHSLSAGSKIVRFLLNRLDERSTWRGLIFVLTAVGINLDPAQMSAILTLGVSIGGALEMLLPDPGGKVRDTHPASTGAVTDNKPPARERGPFDVL